MPNCFCTWQSAFAQIQGYGHAHLPGQSEPKRVDVGNHHVPSACVPCDCRTHQAYRARSGDQHILTQHREGQGSVNGVAERIENGRDILIDGRVMTPDVGHGQRDVFRESASPVDAYAFSVRAKVTPARQAIPAPAASHVPFPAHDVPGIKICDVGAHLRNFAHKLVPDHHRDIYGFLGPVVPLINVQIRATNSRATHTNEHFINANFWRRHVLEPKSRFSFAFYERFHFSSRGSVSM